MESTEKSITTGSTKKYSIFFKFFSLLSVVRGYNILIVAIAQYLGSIFIFSPNKTLKELFVFLTDDDTHLAIVHDNYGSITGVVTMEDMLETILGMEIVDESDKVADLQQLARKSWEERAKKLGIIE